MDLEKQIAELKLKVAEQEAALEKANSTATLKDKELEASKAETKVANDKLAAEVVKSTELETKLTETKKASEALATELTTIKAAELKARRVGQLVEGGLSKEESEKKVAVFAALSDEQFTVVAESLVAAVKAAKTEKPATDIDTDPAAEHTPADAGAAVDKTKAGAAPKLGGEASESDKTVELRKSIASYIFAEPTEKKE